MKERRKTMKDQTHQLKIGHMLSTLILSAILWVGYNIMHMKEVAAELATQIAVDAQKTDFIRRNLNNHRTRKDAHR